MTSRFRGNRWPSSCMPAGCTQYAVTVRASYRIADNAVHAHLSVKAGADELWRKSKSTRRPWRSCRLQLMYSSLSHRDRLFYLNQVLYEEELLLVSGSFSFLSFLYNRTTPPAEEENVTRGIKVTYYTIHFHRRPACVYKRWPFLESSSHFSQLYSEEQHNNPN